MDTSSIVRTRRNATFATSLGLVVVLSATVPAAASVMYVTYLGQVSTGTASIDGGEYDLAGDHYQAVYTYDTSKGARISHVPVSDSLFGGSDYGTGSPVSGVFTLIGPIGSHSSITWTTTGSARSEAFVSGVASYIYDSVDDANYPYFPPLVSFNSWTYGVEPSGGSLDTRFGFKSSYLYGRIDSATRYFIDADLQGPGFVAVDLPEPDSWLMLLMGAGGIGASLRTRRRATVARYR